MLDTFSLLVGLVVGGLLMWLWMDARARWQRGRGLLVRPEKVRLENGERVLKAEAERAHGCQEMLRAVGQFGLEAILIFVLSMILGGKIGWW